jgi:hypothetical protein
MLLFPMGVFCFHVCLSILPLLFHARGFMCLVLSNAAVATGNPRQAIKQSAHAKTKQIICYLTKQKQKQQADISAALFDLVIATPRRSSAHERTRACGVLRASFMLFEHANPR